MTPNQTACPTCGYITGHADNCTAVVQDDGAGVPRRYISPGPLELAETTAARGPEDGSIVPQMTPLVEMLQARQKEAEAAKKVAWDKSVEGNAKVNLGLEAQIAETAVRRMLVDDALKAYDPGIIIPMGGRKDDSGKIRHELLPTDVLDEVGRVLTRGANKYGDRNWEKGMAWNRVIGAALRHLFAVMRGEDRDPETGLLHSAHAICCMMFLCGYQIRKIGTDDRKPL